MMPDRPGRARLRALRDRRSSMKRVRRCSRVKRLRPAAPISPKGRLGHREDLPRSAACTRVSKKLTPLMHGTTVATNAVLEGKGARVGLIAPRAIARSCRSRAASCRAGSPAGSSGPSRTAGGAGGYGRDQGADGCRATSSPIDEASVRARADDLAAKGVEALTVSLINAFSNGAHERRVGELAAENCRHTPVSLARSPARDAGI